MAVETERRHETAELVIHDVLRETEEWLIDGKLEASAPENMPSAPARLRTRQLRDDLRYHRAGHL